MKEQKKLRWWEKVLRSCLVLLLFLGLGFGLGMLMVVVLGENASAMETFLITIVGLYLAIFLHIALHELGHLIFGLATGYRFSSYRLGSVMLLRQDGRLCIRRFSLAGTGGQCLMDPPDMRDGNFPYVLYNLGGSIVNLVLALAAGACLLIPGLPLLLRGFLLVFALCGIFFGLLNGIPLPFSMVNNDGRNTVDIHHSPEARRAFWIQMRANVLTAAGVRTKDMPGDWFVMPEEEALQNPMIATLGVALANRYMDEGNLTAAAEIQTVLLEGKNGMVEVHRRLLLCDRIFCALLDDRLEAARGWLDAEQRQFMKTMARFPSVIRTFYAVALLLDADQTAAEKQLAVFAKCEKQYPYPVDCAAERELMDLVDEKVNKTV